MKRHYLNLTNGLAWIPALRALGISWSHTRICSTDCENEDWDAVLRGLDVGFLADLAAGYDVILYDASNSKELTRAQTEGVPKILEHLEACWLRGMKSPHPNVEYARAFLDTEELHLGCQCRHTQWDNQSSYWREMIREGRDVDSAQ